MKALVLAGVNQALQWQDVTDPVPGAAEAVVTIKAAALNHRDLWIQKGQYAGLKFPIIRVRTAAASWSNAVTA